MTRLPRLLILLTLLAAAPAGAVYTEHGDGTVTDQDTGLMWDKCSWGQTWDNTTSPGTCTGGALLYTWQQALGLAVTANTSNWRGHNDWRLPNRNELESLVDLTRFDPAIDPVAFPNTVSGWYWSSTPLMHLPTYAWDVDFGHVHSRVDYLNNYVRLMRGGRSFDSFDAMASTATPQTGWWWNPRQSGLGFMIERQGNRLLIVGGYYAADGRATWYYSYGPMSGTSYTGNLTTYANGQTLTGSYVPAVEPTSVGTISLSFSDAAHGTVTVPGGSPMAIERFNFGPGGAAASVSFQPQTGSWWNIGESGRGFAVEIQNGQMFMVGYMYDSAGKPIWYTSGGSIVSPSLYQGNWMQWANGPTLGGAYVAPIVANTNVGNVTLTFTSETSATLVLPDGRSIPLSRFSF